MIYKITNHINEAIEFDDKYYSKFKDYYDKDSCMGLKCAECPISKSELGCGIYSYSNFSADKFKNITVNEVSNENK